MEGTKRAIAWVLVLIVFEEAMVSRDDVLPPDGVRVAPPPEGRGEEVGLPHQGEVGQGKGRPRGEHAVAEEDAQGPPR